MYLLLLSERYGTPIDLGFLWYVDQPNLLGVQFVPSEIATIIQRRNVLVSHLAQEQTALPGMLGQENVCKKCPQNQECAILHKVRLFLPSITY